MRECIYQTNHLPSSVNLVMKERRDEMQKLLPYERAHLWYSIVHVVTHSIFQCDEPAFCKFKQAVNALDAAAFEKNNKLYAEMYSLFKAWNVGYASKSFKRLINEFGAKNFNEFPPPDLVTVELDLAVKIQHDSETEEEESNACIDSRGLFETVKPSIAKTKTRRRKMLSKRTREATASASSALSSASSALSSATSALSPQCSLSPQSALSSEACALSAISIAANKQFEIWCSELNVTSIQGAKVDFLKKVLASPHQALDSSQCLALYAIQENQKQTKSKTNVNNTVMQPNITSNENVRRPYGELPNGDWYCDNVLCTRINKRNVGGMCSYCPSGKNLKYWK